MGRTKEEALECIRILHNILEREGVDDNGTTLSIGRLIEEHGVENAKGMVEIMRDMFQSDPGKCQMIDNLLRDVF